MTPGKPSYLICVAALLAAAALMMLAGGCRHDSSVSLSESRVRTEQQPHMPQVWVSLGEAYAQEKMYNDAYIAYKQAIELDDQNFQALLGLAESCFQLQDPETGLEWVAKALELQPEAPAALGLRGRLYLISGKLDQALPDLEKAVNHDPSRLEERLGLIAAYRAKGQNRQALIQAAKTVKQFPTSARAHSANAALLEVAKALDHAEQEYHLAIKYDPALLRAKFGLASLLVHRKKDLTEARKLALEVDAEGPGDGTARGLAAWSYYLEGKERDALRELIQVHQQHPENLTVLLWINQAAGEMGERDVARAAAYNIRAILKERGFTRQP